MGDSQIGTAQLVTTLLQRLVHQGSSGLASLSQPSLGNYWVLNSGASFHNKPDLLHSLLQDPFYSYLC